MSTPRERALAALLDALRLHSRASPRERRILLTEQASEALRGWWTTPDPTHAPGSLGALLRARRLDLGLPQEEVARRTGRSQGTLSRWESGDGPPPNAGELATWLRVLEATEALQSAALACAEADWAAFRQRRAAS